MCIKKKPDSLPPFFWPSLLFNYTAVFVPFLDRLISFHSMYSERIPSDNPSRISVILRTISSVNNNKVTGFNNSLRYCTNVPLQRMCMCVCVKTKLYWIDLLTKARKQVYVYVDHINATSRYIHIKVDISHNYLFF